MEEAPKESSTEQTSSKFQASEEGDRPLLNEKVAFVQNFKHFKYLVATNNVNSNTSKALETQSDDSKPAKAELEPTFPRISETSKTFDLNGKNERIFLVLWQSRTSSQPRRLLVELISVYSRGLLPIINLRIP